ncbi:TonB-dependent receptor [Parabacteroides sp.]
MNKKTRFSHIKTKQKRLIRTMKIFLLFAFLTAGSCFASETYSQETSFSINYNNRTVKEVINEIENSSEFIFFYLDKSIDLNRKVSINAENKKIDNILDQLFSGTENNYTISDRQIIISKKDAPVNTETNQSKRTITGVVIDEMGPITGANIIVKGTTVGCITDLNGKFILDNVPDNAIIQISYIGYLPQEIEVGNQSNFNIVLKEDNQSLDEVVVVGYGTVRKADLAGSVSVLDSKSFKDQPIKQVSDALQGRVSGVQVQNSGVPGGTVKIRVRGSGSINRSNDPLYVIDGIVRESGLTGLNPEDIQSMQILKDASSTAIYGSRGANGVVLITTKTGKANTRQVMFDAQIGVGTVAKRYDTLNPYEFATLYNTYRANTFDSNQLSAFQNGTAGTNWQDEIYKTGITQDYKLTFSGGSEKTQYLISGNYVGQEGVVIENSNKRYQARANITSQVLDWLHVTADVNASHNVRKSGDFNAGKGNIINVAMNYSPVLGILNEDGTYTRDPYSALTQNSPVGQLREQVGETLNDIVNARVDLKFDILPGLTFTTSNGIDYNDQKGYSFSTKKVTNSNNGMGNSDAYRMTLQTTNNLTYTGKWGDHALTATAVYEATQSEYRYMTLNGSGLLTESVGWWNVNMASSRTSDNSYSKWGLMSGVGRVMYNYKDRYMLTGTIRADGSSKFFNDKWGWFPSIAAAWSLGNEDFMENQNIFQDLKIRASYGLIGSQAINPYATLGLMSKAMYAFGGSSQYTGYWVGTTVATPDLSWETTHQFDLGVDFSVLNHRLNISFDYFDKRTKDGLLQRSIPNYDGGGSYWVNAAEVSNRGIDFSINATIFDTPDFSWSSTFNGTYLKNEVKDLGGLDFVSGISPAAGMIPTDGVTRVEVGQPIGAFYGYKWTGLDAEGKDSFEDRNNDGIIDSSDRTFIGKSNPDFTLGWNNTFRWKNWDLNMFFTGSFGADRLNLVRFTGTAMTGDFAFITLREYLNDNFDVKGQAARYPSVSVTGNDYQSASASTKFLESANYFRLDNLSLSYNLPKKVAKFADLRFTFSCQNLFTITSYKGMDPAGISFVDPNNGSVDVNDGIDLGAYPLTRSYTFGVRLNF